MSESLRHKEDQRIANALREVGINASSVFDLVNASYRYPNAIPVLLRGLDEVQDPWIREGVVRALSVKEARGIAEDRLLEQFENIPPDAKSMQSLKWAIGNALSVVATTRSLEAICRLVRDTKHGKAREMLAVALGNINDTRAVDVLLELLDDEQVLGHVVIALGKLRSEKARVRLVQLLHHKNPWIRREVTKALSKL